VREIRPYATVRGAQLALDNGGRFFNLFTKASDDLIDAAELARAAGVYTSGHRAFLYFEMATMALADEDVAQVTSLLSADLKLKYVQHRPQVLLPSVVEAQGLAGRSAIVTGYPVYVEDRTQFAGFIMIFTGKAMIMLPIFDRFDVYEVFDTPDLRVPRTVIATTRGSRRLDGIHARFGGMLKELRFDDRTGKGHGLYLEVLYYTPLGMAKALPGTSVG